MCFTRVLPRRGLVPRGFALALLALALPAGASEEAPAPPPLLDVEAPLAPVDTTDEREPPEHEEHTEATAPPFVQDVDEAEPERPNTLETPFAPMPGRSASPPPVEPRPRPRSRSTPRRTPVVQPWSSPEGSATSSSAPAADPFACVTRPIQCRDEAHARWDERGISGKELLAGTAAGLGALGGMSLLVGGAAGLLYQTQGPRGLDLLPLGALVLGIPGYGLVVGVPLGLAAGAGAFLATAVVAGFGPAFAAGATAGSVVAGLTALPVLGWLGPVVGPAFASYMAAACTGYSKLEEE